MTHFSVGETLLAEEQKKHCEKKGRKNSSSDAKMTFGQAAAIHMQNLEEKVTIKQRTRNYWKETLMAVYKSWPALMEAEVRRITPATRREWAVKYVKHNIS